MEGMGMRRRRDGRMRGMCERWGDGCDGGWGMGRQKRRGIRVDDVGKVGAVEIQPKLCLLWLILIWSFILVIVPVII